MERGGESTRLVCVCARTCVCVSVCVVRVCACAHSHGRSTPQHPVTPSGQYLVGGKIKYQASLLNFLFTRAV